MMQYKEIDDLTNKKIASAERTYAEDSITITTELNNSVTVNVNQEIAIEDLVVIDDVGIQFIVKIGDVFYTSPQVKTNLENARDENNPFYQTEFINVVTIDTQRIINLLSELDYAHKQLGVSINPIFDIDDDETINSVLAESIIKQLFWATTPVPIDGSVPSHYSNIGEWTIQQIPGKTFNHEQSVALLTEEQLEEIASQNQPDDEEDEESNGDNNENNGDGANNGNPGGGGNNGNSTGGSSGNPGDSDSGSESPDRTISLQ